MKNLPYKSFLLLFFIASTAAHGQLWKRKQAEDLYWRFAYTKAIPLYETLKHKMPKDYRNLADCYYHLGKFDKAAGTYKKFFEQGGYSVEDLYNMSYYLMMSGNYEEGLKWMKKYARLRPNDSRARRFLENPDYYQQLLNEKSDVVLKNVSTNYKNSDFGPAYYKDSTIVFTSARGFGREWNGNEQPFLDLFVANETKDGDLVNAKRFMGDINKKYHDGPAAFNAEGNYMVITRNIYQSKVGLQKIYSNRLWLYESFLKDNGKWSKPQPLPFNGLNYSCGHPSLSADGNTLYFASDMPGGYGKSDIYVVHRDGNGRWQSPINLGPQINTEGDEKFPFYDEKDGFLFFASDGLPGLGGLDLFVSKIGENGKKYSKPVNLAVPMNTRFDDFSMIYDQASHSGYMSSNRPGGKGDDDIYAFKNLMNFIQLAKFYDIVGTVHNKDTGKPIVNATVTVKDKKGRIVNQTITDDKGDYSFKQFIDPSGYVVEVHKKSFKPVSKKVVKADLKTFLIKKDFVLEPKIPAYCKLSISPLYYDLDKSIIKEEYYPKLDSVVDLMKQYPNMRIIIASHTDSRATSEYNMELSKRRAYAVRDYLVKKGIDTSRMEVEWYGETQLVNECSDGVPCPEEKHRLNRRTEFIIICPNRKNMSN